MRHLGLFLVGSLALAACASSNNTPPAASSETVAQATNEPNRGPDFAPASSDGLATTPAAKREYATGQSPSTTPSTTPTTGTAPHTQEFATGEREPVDTTNRNAAGTPTDRSLAPTPAPKTDADNARVNKRDRDSAALTPMDQGSSASDRAITQQIRKDLMNDKSLSFTAKNVKVITINGKITLRGPVKSEAERASIEAAARRAAGGDGARVDSQLEISK
ncbi:MAG TPA: BON domain-containing protein [Polyangiaceae bacterium]|nr:BON domain-containing protein [Polyangiaceae bacterium]